MLATVTVEVVLAMRIDKLAPLLCEFTSLASIEFNYKNE